MLGAFGLLAKQILHCTGLPCVGLNGTVVLLPHSEQVTCVSVRSRPFAPSLLALHCLQCFGSLTKPFSRKNSCSPAENTNSKPQPTHRTSLSAKDIILPPNSAGSEKGQRGESSPLCENWQRVRHHMPFNLEKLLGIKQLAHIFCSQPTQESPSGGAFSFSGMGAACGDYMSSLLPCQPGLNGGSILLPFLVWMQDISFVLIVNNSRYGR